MFCSSLAQHWPACVLGGVVSWEVPGFIKYQFSGFIEFALPPRVTGVDLDPRESRLPKKDGTVVSSNYLATFAYIRGRKMRLTLLGSLDCDTVGKGGINSKGYK